MNTCDPATLMNEAADRLARDIPATVQRMSSDRADFRENAVAVDWPAAVKGDRGAGKQRKRRKRKHKPEPEPKIIQITREQLLEGVDVGVARDAMHPGPGNVILDRTFASILGTVAEMGVALFTGYKWTGKFFPTMTALKDWMKTDGRDVEHMEVRATPWRNGNLLLQPTNPPGNIFVLVRMPRMWQGEIRIIGWCYGFEGLCKKYWKNLGRGKKCFVVPGWKLHSMDTLPKVALDAANPKLVKFLQQWVPTDFVAER
jgi:hypothetical protein